MKVEHKRSYRVMVLSFFLVLFLSSPAFEAETKNEESEANKNLINVEVEGIIQKKDGDTVTLPLRLALEIALERNLDIQIEKIRVPIAEEVIIEKEARFDPALFGEATNRRFEQQTSSALSGTPIFKENEQHGRVGTRKLFRFGLEAESYFENSRYRANSSFEGLDPQYKNFLVLTVRQPLLQDFGPKVNTTDINVAKNDREIIKNIFLLQVMETLNQVEQTYYDLSGMNETLQLRRESLRLAEKLLSDNRKRFDAGLTHIGEVQEAETAVASREEEVISAHQTMKDVTNIFKNVLQVRPESPLYPLMIQTEGFFPSEKEIPSYEESFREALTRRPDYLQKKIEVESREVILKFNKNHLLPRLDLVGTFGLNGLSGEAQTITFAGQSARNPFGGGYADSWEHLLEGDGYEWNIGLTIEIPLGNRADRSRYQQSRLDKERAIMEVKNLEDKIDLEIKVALEDIKGSRDRIEVAERFVSLAAKTLSQEEERMKAGLSDTFRVLNFQEDLMDAKIRKVRALVDYQKALAQLYKSMGTNLERHEMSLNIPECSTSLQ